MRLIDADKLIEEIAEMDISEQSKIFSVNMLRFAKIAYDIDKVVERLERCKYWTPSTYDEDGYCNDDSMEVIDLDDAIGIVRGGVQYGT